MKKYNIILADPPWKHNDKAAAGERGAGFKYNLMDLGQLMAMRAYIDSLAARDCLLAMWWVGPMPEEALLLVKAWGFTLKTMKGFTWYKTTKKDKEHFGMGNWTRCNTEDCLFAVRGRPKRLSASVRQIIASEVREHSRKPDEARDRLVELLGNLPRIELFARQRCVGWDSMGDELPKKDHVTGEEVKPSMVDEIAEVAWSDIVPEDASDKIPMPVPPLYPPMPADGGRAALVDAMIAGQANLEDPSVEIPEDLEFASGTREDEFKIEAQMEMPEGEEY